MFSLTDIINAQGKVLSGADFPLYITDLHNLGVNAYEIFVADGHAIYFDIHQFQITAPDEYLPLKIASIIDLAQFKACLKLHQAGQTDYLQFCKDAARCGVYKWKISVPERTCSYLDLLGNVLMLEHIPV